MPTVTKVALALGSNLGNRFEYLQSALDALITNQVIQEVNVSQIYETEPVGGPDQGAYLNAVVTGEVSLGPREFLQACHDIEASLGRERVVRWGARTIDIDLLAYDNLVTDNIPQSPDSRLPDIELPHPRTAERNFVLIPWNDIEPERIIPGHGSVADCLARLNADGVRLFAPGDMLVQVAL